MPIAARRVLGLASAQAECLPLPWELSDLQVKIRPANLVMVAGAPGTGKSMFVQWLVSRLGLPTLYMSADMTPHDALTRLSATLSGHTTDAIAEALTGPGAAYYEELWGESHIDFCFDSSPSLDDLVAELDAWVEVWDAWPQVVVVDNLVNVEGSEEWQGQMFLLSELHSLARTTGATVFVLHHASEANQRDVTKPASKKDIQNKVTHYPEVVLTVALDQVNEIFRVAAVKNRSGKADATGSTFIELAADPARCTYSKARLAAVRDYWSEVE